MAESFFFGPTYVVATVTDAPGGILAALMMLSHFPMLLGVTYAYAARHARLATAGLFSLVVSAFLYHPCRSNMYCLGQNVDVWRQLDHIAVLILVGMLALHLMMIMLARPKSQFFFIVAGYLTIFAGVLVVKTLPYTFLSAVIMGLWLLGVAIVRVALLTARGDLCGCAPGDDGSMDKAARVYTTKMGWLLFVGITTAVIALVFYFIPESSNDITNGVIHCLWHVLSGISLLTLSASVSELEEATLLEHSRHAYGV